MSGFDFGQHFNTNRQDSENKGPGMNLVEELLKEVASNMQQNDEGITQEEAFKAFQKKYGSPENFLMNHFRQMSEPYEEAMVDAVVAKAQSEGKGIYGSVLTASAIDVARHFNMKMMSDNARHHGQQDEDVANMKAAMLATTISRILPDNSPKDSMIAIHALLSIVSLKLAELTMQLDAQELAKEARKNNGF